MMDQFDRVADVYARYRPTYPAEVFQKVMARNGGHTFLEGVDVGCGAGHSTKGLHSICKQVTGVEPFDNLRNQAEKHFPEYAFMAGAGEATGLPDDSVDIVTVANAFYWMNREVAIREFARILRPKGQLALYRYYFPVVEAASNTVVQSHLGRFWNQHRETRLTRDDDSAQLLKESGLFQNIETSKVSNVLTMPIEGYVGFLASTSYVSRHLETLKLADRQLYLDDFRDELMAAHGEPNVDVNFDIHMFMAEAT